MAVAVRSGGRRSVSGLHLQGISTLLLAIEHYFREDLAGLPVDFEVILALVPVALHHVIRDLDKRREDYIDAPRFIPRVYAHHSRKSKIMNYQFIEFHRAFPH